MNEKHIKLLNEAKDEYIKGRSPLTKINLVLIDLMVLKGQEDYEANVMGKELVKELREAVDKPEGTLRSNIDELNKLTMGELKSTWGKNE